MAFVLKEYSADPIGWHANITGDLTSTEDIKAATSDGSSHYIRSVSINGIAAQTVTIGAGETTSAVTNPIVGPVSFTTSGGQFNHTFISPLKIAADTAITIDASTSDVVCVVVSGYTK